LVVLLFFSDFFLDYAPSFDFLDLVSLSLGILGGLSDFYFYLSLDLLLLFYFFGGLLI
jgi:hypothetical protein